MKINLCSILCFFEFLLEEKIITNEMINKYNKTTIFNVYSKNIEKLNNLTTSILRIRELLENDINLYEKLKSEKEDYMEEAFFIELQELLDIK